MNKARARVRQRIGLIVHVIVYCSHSRRAGKSYRNAVQREYEKMKSEN